MKILLTLLVLNFTFIYKVAFANDIFINFDKRVPIENIEIKGLSAYHGNYITLYLVNARKLLGPEPTIYKVIQTLGTQLINSNDVVLKDTVIEDDGENLIQPNYIVVVVHKNAEHALNRHPITSGKNFQAPEYINPQDQVVMTPENSVEITRKSYLISSLPELSSGISLDLSR